MKRFYKTVSVAGSEAGHAVQLDGKQIKTPAKSDLVVPNEVLAKAIAAEWEAQDDEIDPQTLRLTRLSNSAIDRVVAHRVEVVAEISGFADTDLVCYRADQPDELIRRQAEAWDPLIGWAGERYGMAFDVTDGLMPIPQSAECLSRARHAVEAFDHFGLSGLHAATSLCGSVVLGLAIADGRLDGQTAWTLSLIDETWQIDEWGEEHEATIRREGLLSELTAVANYLSLIRAA